MIFQRSFGQGKQELARVANDSQHILSVAFPFFSPLKMSSECTSRRVYEQDFFFGGGLIILSLSDYAEM